MWFMSTLLGNATLDHFINYFGYFIFMTSGFLCTITNGNFILK